MAMERQRFTTKNAGSTVFCQCVGSIETLVNGCVDVKRCQILIN